MNQIKDWEKAVNELLLMARVAKESYSTAQQRANEAKARLAAIEEARTIAQSVAQALQQQTHSAITKVVSRCLSAVFEQPYTFEIIFEQKRGRTEAKMVFKRNGHVVDPLTASGGGVVDLAALALRLASLKLRRPAGRDVLIFDEAFKSPSPHYRERVKLLMETLSEEMGVQFIFVSNIMELVTGNVINLDTLPTNQGAAKATKKRLRMREEE